MSTSSWFPDPRLFVFHAEMAGYTLPAIVHEHPGIGEAASAFPWFALVGAFLVVAAGHNSGASVSVHDHTRRLKDVGLIGLVPDRSYDLRFVVELAFGCGHDEILGQEELHG